MEGRAFGALVGVSTSANARYFIQESWSCAHCSIYDLSPPSPSTTHMQNLLGLTANYSKQHGRHASFHASFSLFSLPPTDRWKLGWFLPIVIAAALRPAIITPHTQEFQQQNVRKPLKDRPMLLAHLRWLISSLPPSFLPVLLLLLSGCKYISRGWHRCQPETRSFSQKQKPFSVMIIFYLQHQQQQHPMVHWPLRAKTFPQYLLLQLGSARIVLASLFFSRLLKHGKSLLVMTNVS